MATVVFDFDSTLIPGESLEMALARTPGVDEAAGAEIERITRQGMEGEIGFGESLAARLAIARPRRATLTKLGEDLAGMLTDGAAELVASLLANDHGVWIVSGAFREVLLPAARTLGVPETRVHGVRPLWTADGEFAGLDPEDGFSRSKVEGVRALRPDWPPPVVGVGDGATDHALLAAGLVQAFVAYTEHARRESVLSLDVPRAADMHRLGALLETLLR